MNSLKQIKSKENLIRLGFIVISVLPFFIIYVSHWLRTPESHVPTGFIQIDMPYYSANGREIFERGNGLTYPNPYDTTSTPPAIYFHWFPWLLGVGIKYLKIDPGVLFVLFGILSGFLCAWFTLIIVEKILPKAEFKYPLFLLVMWGGGVLCLGAVIFNILDSDSSTFATIFRYDPGGGWWFLNWGRNLLYPTEATYHAIVALIWIAVLTQQWWGAVFGTVALATTHPFSGVQYLLIMSVWLGILTIIYKSYRNRITKYWLAIILTLIIFLLYYKVFLLSFPQHQVIHQDWSLKWTLNISSIILAYSPVGVLAISRIIIDRGRLPIEVGFFITCFLISLLLAKHELFMAPQQPLHFTRGHIWMPLMLIALPLIQRLLIHFKQKYHQYLFVSCSVILGGIAISDNLASTYSKSAFVPGIYLTLEQRKLLTQIDLLGYDGVLLTVDNRLGYLSATYTSMQPYLGHRWLTPDIHERQKRVKDWRQAESKNYDLLENIDYILIKKQELPSSFDWSNWSIEINSENYVFIAKNKEIE